MSVAQRAKKVEVANEYLQNNMIKKSYFLKSAIFRFVGTGTVLRRRHCNIKCLYSGRIWTGLSLFFLM
jgi:hypothetical protein